MPFKGMTLEQLCRLTVSPESRCRPPPISLLATHRIAMHCPLPFPHPEMSTASAPLDRHSLPDAAGHFGPFGGVYVAETLMTALQDLERAYDEARVDPAFQAELRHHLKEFAGRPTELYFAERLTQHCGGAKIYFKREDILHTGAHKINNALAQVLLARRMGKKRIIAETGAGQHGVATAAACAKFGLECVVYMGSVDMARQALNVFRMRLLGATVAGGGAGPTARQRGTNGRTTHYVLGTANGPHPFPQMVRDFQSVIGREARAQMLEREGRLPDELIACVGGGSNAIGLFYEFLEDTAVRMTGVEAGGRGIKRGDHAARFAGGRLGVLQGCKTLILQDQDGQIDLTHSVSAGLDYAAVGPEHLFYQNRGRIEFTYATDDEVLAAFQLCSRLEGIIPALESTHAIAFGIKRAAELPKDKIVIINLSGRGDKDVQQVAALLGQPDIAVSPAP